MTSRYLFLIIFLCSMMFESCTHKQEAKPVVAIGEKETRDKLIEVNKQAVKVENDQIDRLIADSNWKTTESQTGLRYQIIEKGKGAKVSTGNVVRFEYSVHLMDGKEIYSSKKSGIKEFKVGSGGVESGLEEGILYLRVGDKARFIIPSYLAYGLTGDQDQIPPKATLIYTVTLIDSK